MYLLCLNSGQTRGHFSFTQFHFECSYSFYEAAYYEFVAMKLFPSWLTLRFFPYNVRAVEFFLKEVILCISSNRL